MHCAGALVSGIGFSVLLLLNGDFRTGESRQHLRTVQNGGRSVSPFDRCQGAGKSTGGIRRIAIRWSL